MRTSLRGRLTRRPGPRISDADWRCGPATPFQSPARRLRGFTLIEVLVVVAIIALLVAILLPSLNRAREQGKTAVCSTQIRQLMAAALMYTHDYAGRLPGTGINDAPFESQYYNGTRKDYLTWFGTWTTMIDHTLTDAVDIAAWKNAPKGGRLWRYYRD